MKVYICYQITDKENLGAEVTEVFANEADAKKFVDENQKIFKDWAGEEYREFFYEEWKVS